MEREDAHDFKAIHDAVQVLKTGGVIVYPTDTSYGLGCDPLNPEALKTVYAIKNRTTSSPLPVIAANILMVKQWCEWPVDAKKLASTYWPGPLTFVLATKRPLPRELTGFRTSIAIRVPAHEVAKALSRRLGRPIVSTSANLAGKGEIFEPDRIVEMFGDAKNQPDLFLDGGTLPTSKPSTIVDLTKGKPYILRKGAVTLHF
ncbi:MAG: threonylcarbamoyl-AMP synthase [Candidatus Kerfeldbacteria bacterium]|nr:threonylcarbamoyl-AMP synthase [Candidatus Kerfeldbacteria bacterium]